MHDICVPRHVRYYTNKYHVGCHHSSNVYKAFSAGTCIQYESTDTTSYPILGFNSIPRQIKQIKESALSTYNPPVPPSSGTGLLSASAGAFRSSAVPDTTAHDCAQNQCGGLPKDCNTARVMAELIASSAKVEFNVVSARYSKGVALRITFPLVAKYSEAVPGSR